MKKIGIILLIVVILVGLSLHYFNKNSDAIYAKLYTNEQLKNGEITKEVYVYDNLEREYLLYIPEGLEENAPLVFVLHGYSSNMEIVNKLSEMNELAEAYGFAVCYPNGTKLASKRYWNAQFTYGEYIDDIGFLVDLAGKLQVEHDLDVARTYACGMSNGGYMSYALGVFATDTFSRIASVCGTTSYGTWEAREDTKPFALLQIYGLQDEVVAFEGSPAEGPGWQGAPAIDIIIDYFAEINEATASSEEYSDGIRRIKYTGGYNPVWLIAGDHWGHEWPKGEEFSASETIVEFFELNK